MNINELREKVKNGDFDDNELIDLVLHLERENQELEKELEIIIKCSNDTNDLANKYKEVIDKIKQVQLDHPKINYSYDYMIYRYKVEEILKEVD